MTISRLKPFKAHSHKIGFSSQLSSNFNEIGFGHRTRRKFGNVTLDLIKGGVAARHRKGATAGRFFKSSLATVTADAHDHQMLTYNRETGATRAGSRFWLLNRAKLRAYWLEDHKTDDLTHTPPTSENKASGKEMQSVNQDKVQDNSSILSHSSGDTNIRSIFNLNNGWKINESRKSLTNRSEDGTQAFVTQSCPASSSSIKHSHDYLYSSACYAFHAEQNNLDDDKHQSRVWQTGKPQLNDTRFRKWNTRYITTKDSRSLQLPVWLKIPDRMDHTWKVAEK
ncbi:hypothetical protein CLF_100363 [Clonorchis sinensis]|uniref:Uncharacterized protein n=1 Tax=Clonorchis sinensis TaxID=79923 RepID=G7Y3A1_CLOSI|nr:hypothetical protein CLF_100363 [Clonorchis sinensis]